MAIDLPDIEWGSLWTWVLAAAVGGVGASISTSVKDAPAAALRHVRGRMAAKKGARDEELRADHFVITTGWSSGDLAGSKEGFVACIRAAPAKDFPAPVRIDIGRLALLVGSTFGELFSTEPEACLLNEVVRFRPRDPSLGSGEFYLQVWSTGLFEATVPTPHRVTESGELHIPVLEIARTLAPAIEALQRGGYENALGPAAPLPLGLDWELKVSRQMVDTTSAAWDALEFPGRSPRRGTGHRPDWTRPGFGHDQLLSVPTTTSAVDILMPAFDDLLGRTGYYEADGAVEDLREAIGEFDAS